MQDVGTALADDRGTAETAALRLRFEARTATIAVVGLGYVGLPLLLAANDVGFRTIGFDSDRAKIDSLRQGRTTLQQIAAVRIDRLIRGSRFEARSDLRQIGDVDAIIICVPTPLTPDQEPDLDAVRAVCTAVAPTLRRGQLVVLESTTYPGTTKDIVRPILESHGLRAGSDFYLAYSPEREDPGRRTHDVTNTPKIIGADDKASLDLASAMYGQWVDVLVPVASSDVAEAVKITENVFRAVNIALVNELKMIFSTMSIDVWDVIDAAKTKPFGYMPFYPGPGLGGHCIPIDPFYLAWRAKTFGASAPLIELAGQINRAMPAYVVDRLQIAMMAASGRTLSGARILVTGLAYKKNIADLRESPSIEIIDLLSEHGAIVDFHDTFVPAWARSPDREPSQSVMLTEASIRRYDAVLIATDHDAVDYALIAAHAALVVDTRNVFARLGLTPARLVKA